MTREKTTHVRVNRKLLNELRMKFPGVRTSELFQMAYDTSLLKLEGKLRGKKKKQKR